MRTRGQAVRSGWRRYMATALMVAVMASVAMRLGAERRATGTLIVSSEPSGAAVYVDGQMVGQTPVTLPGVAEGDHRVRLAKDGYLDNSRVSRVEAGRVGEVRVRLTPRAGQTPTAQDLGLKIIVIEGEDAVNIIQQKVGSSPVVEVRDRNDLPVAGVVVTFALASKSGTFSGGLQSVTVTTNAAGRAAAGQLTSVTSGPMQINVTAAYQGQTATATISQTNFATAADAAKAAKSAGQGSGGSGSSAGSAAGGGISKLAVIGIVGGAAAGGLVAAKALQGPPACSFAVSQSSISAGGAASSTSISVTASPADCEPANWDATSNASFVSVSGGGTGSGAVTLNIAANPATGSPRTATVTIAGQTVTVSQGVSCAFTLSRTTIAAPSAASAQTVNVTTSPSGCSPSNWTATSGASFITVSPASGSGAGTVTLNVAALASGTRSGTVTIAGQAVTVTQAVATPCNQQEVQGGDVPETRSVSVGRTSGTFEFRFDTFTQPDRMVVSYEGRTLFDTGCVGASGFRNLTFSGAGSTVTVQVIPNCAGGFGTAWTFRVSCAQ